MDDRFQRERNPQELDNGRDSFKRQRSQSPSKNDQYKPDYDRDGFRPAPKYNNNNGFRQKPYHHQGNQNDMFGYQDQRYLDPAKLDYLVSFKQFQDYTRSTRTGKNMSDNEFSDAYKEYKDAFQFKQYQTFFDEHKEEEWFKEKYHPETLKSLRETNIIPIKKELLATFKAELAAGKFDSVCFDEIEEKKAENGDVAMDDNKEVDASAVVDNKESSPTSIDEYKSFALFIKSIPPNIKRAELLSVVSKTAGFKHLSIADPNSSRNFYRFGWIVYDSETNSNAAYLELNGEKIGDFSLQLCQNKSQPLTPRSVPFECTTPHRLSKDNDSAKELIQVLDAECGGGEFDGISIIQERLTDLMLTDDEHIKKHLDLHILYLRRVHCYDYYTSWESVSPEDFYRRSVASTRRLSPDAFGSPLQMLEKIDSRIRLRISVGETLIECGEELGKVGGKSYEGEMDAKAGEFVKKEAEGKFRCKECEKLFKGVEFVKKHVRLKHSQFLLDIKEEVQYYNMYVRDHNKVLAPSPVATPTLVSSTSSRGRGRRSYGHDRRGSPQRSDRRHTMDPRGIRSYVDLDAPVVGEVEINYDF